MLNSNGEYAALMDDWYAEYIVNTQHCELAMIGNFNPLDVAMAVRKGSALKNRLDIALNGMKKGREFNSLKRNWWQGKCTSASDSQRANLVTYVIIVHALILSLTSLYI